MSFDSCGGADRIGIVGVTERTKSGLDKPTGLSNSISTHMRRRRVLPWPQFRMNPYLPRLMRELEARGFDDVRESYYGDAVARLDAGDWVHFHWPGARLISPTRAGYRANLLRFRRRLDELGARGIRMCWTAHNLLPHDDPSRELAREARHALLAAVEHVFVHFPGARARLADELGWRGPVTTIPHGHYADAFAEPPPRHVARAALGLADDAFVVLLFGTLRPYKGIAQAIAAFRAVGRDCDRMIIAGLPAAATVFADLAAARADARIRVDARVIPDDEVPGLLVAADAFLLAHRDFFTSGAAVLAASFGLPIVGPAIEHLASFGGEPRLWPTSSDVAGLAAGLDRLRGVGAIDRTGLRRASILDWSWDLAADRTAAVLHAERDRCTTARLTP
jgi:beta-1,4-mannosyltransferase